MPWCASVSLCTEAHNKSCSRKERTSARVWLNHVGKHQLHLVQQVVNKGGQIGEIEGEDIWVRSVTEGNVLLLKCRGTGPRPCPLS